jgi:hypothetical protein
MRNIILLMILPFITFELLADVGNAYRYKVNISLQDQSGLTGYFFFTTYQNGFNQNEKAFKDYIFTNYHFPIFLYENIKTIRISDYLTVDFAIKGSEKTIEKNEIESIVLIEEIETPVGSRLRLLSEEEDKLLNQDFINTENIYNESYAVNCSVILLNWDKSNDLVKLKNGINKRIEELISESNIQGASDYIENLKKDMVNRNILLFQYCGPL